MFNLKPEEVNFEKIEAFCKEQIPEGETIEYKRAFPSDATRLAKSISAMANTHGGIILIGVKANETTNTPIMPIQGIKLTEGLEEKITSICLRNIYQPYFPSVKICDFKNKRGENRAVVFIRVYQSDQTPHAINSNTDVYLRIKSQNEPFRKATVDEIEWLRDKRKKAVELRETILARAQERYDALSARLLDGPRRQRFRMSFVTPLFCNQQIISRYELFERLLDKLRGHGFDLQASNLQRIGKTGNEALYYFEAAEGNGETRKYVQYGEFSTYGLVLRRESLWEDCRPAFYEKFNADSFIRQAYETFKTAMLFYSAAGYNGMIRVGIDVRGFRNREIVRVDRSSPMGEELIARNEVENEFSFTQNLLAQELEEKLDSVILEIYRQFLFTCGLGKDRKHLEQLCLKHCKSITKR